MTDVPDELQALVSNLRGIKKKNFSVVLQAAALALEGAKHEIDTDAVSESLVESGVPADEQKPVIKSCRFLLEEVQKDGASCCISFTGTTCHGNTLLLRNRFYDRNAQQKAQAPWVHPDAPEGDH